LFRDLVTEQGLLAERGMDDGPGEPARPVRAAEQAGSRGRDGDCVPLVVLSSHTDQGGSSYAEQERSDAGDLRDLEDVLDEMGAVCVCLRLGRAPLLRASL